MTISLVTICFNGYGRFLGQWLAFVSSMYPQPSEVVIVLGQNHGCIDVSDYKLIYPEYTFIEYRKKPTFGKLRNIGIAKTSSEWTWFVSIDDKPHRMAIYTFNDVLLINRSVSYICAQWITKGLGERIETHISPTPQQMALELSQGLKGGFIIGHSPFKRTLWQQHPYKNTDLPNYDFLLHCVLNGAVFAQAHLPTTTYLRRSTSHSKTVLKSIMSKARKQKRILQRGLLEYYGY